MYICTQGKINLQVFRVGSGRNMRLNLGNKHKFWRRDRLGGRAKELSGGAGQATGAWGFCYRSVSVKKTKGRAWTRPWYLFEAERAAKWGSFEVWSVGTFQQSFYCVSHISAWVGEVGEGAKAFCLEKDRLLRSSQELEPFWILSVWSPASICGRSENTGVS